MLYSLVKKLFKRYIAPPYVTLFGLFYNKDYLSHIGLRPLEALRNV